MSVFVYPSDRAKALRGDPERWYDLALEYLPLPAAFREAAKARRAQIRARRKAGEPYDELLADLYRLACLHNLVIGEGAFEGRPEHWRAVFSEPLPRELWDDERFPYEEIGHEHLTVLGVQDRKWMEDAWGTPGDHRRVRELDLDLERRLSNHLAGAWQREQERFETKKREILATMDAQYEAKQGCMLGTLIVLGGLSGALTLVFVG